MPKLWLAISAKKPSDPRSLLELHHIEHHVDGENTVENLITLCIACRDGGSALSRLPSYFWPYAGAAGTTAVNIRLAESRRGCRL